MSPTLFKGGNLMPGKWHQIAGKRQTFAALKSLSAAGRETLGKKKPGSARLREETLITAEDEERSAPLRWLARALQYLPVAKLGT